MIERVILSAGAMLIFSVSFQIDQMPEGSRYILIVNYIGALELSGDAHWVVVFGGRVVGLGKEHQKNQVNWSSRREWKRMGENPN